MRVTRAVTHIRLCDANHAKMEVLDTLAAEYLRLCQAYTTYFCTEAQPEKYAAPCFDSPLSQRWQRVAIQQAAGIAQSWRSNYAIAHQDYLDLLAKYQEEPNGDPPAWKEWNTPVLKEPVIQANANVAVLQPSQVSSFEYWLRLSTLEKGQPIFLPVKLANYHRQALTGKKLNTSTVLARKVDGWWLTLSYDEDITVVTPNDAPIIGLDVGIVNFITASTGKQYGTFHGKLAERHRRDREKRRRKAKLRACLKKKGVQRLPSTRNQKLARHVRQEINRAVNGVYRDHPDAQVAYEQLNVAEMKFKARRMNAYFYASNLAHISAQLAWGATKRGVRARSQERLQLPGMSSLSFCVPREPPEPTDVLLCGLRAYASCRCERGREPGESSGRSRACCLWRSPSHQSLAGESTPGVESQKRLAVVQPPA